ncbi:hypothetical protein GQ44DRAFT_731167 [Phaeosphaeriaceae sp. PMI808]|nr:hypothetical protein GQ44DRAFT_731167 [Phaeosphaeriaceae sp. PMI808]
MPNLCKQTFGGRSCYAFAESIISWVPDWTDGRNIAGILTSEILNSDKDKPYTFTYDATPGIYCDARFAADLSRQLGSFKLECQIILESAHRYLTKANLDGVDLEETPLRALATSWRHKRDGKLQIDKWRDYFREWLRGDESRLENPTALLEVGISDKIPTIQRCLKSVAVPIFDKSNSEISGSLNGFISSISDINSFMDEATDLESEVVSKIKASLGSILSRSAKLKEVIAVQQLRKGLMEEKPSAYEALAISATEEDLIGEGTSPTTNVDNSIPLAFTSAFRKAMQSSTRIFLTQNGYIGRAGNGVKEGDNLCVLLGCALPFVLRPIDGHYELVSESYVPEIMRGEAMISLDEGKRKIEQFELH